MRKLIYFKHTLVHATFLICTNIGIYVQFYVLTLCTPLHYALTYPVHLPMHFPLHIHGTLVRPSGRAATWG